MRQARTPYSHDESDQKTIRTRYQDWSMHYATSMDLKKICRTLYRPKVCRLGIDHAALLQ